MSYDPRITPARPDLAAAHLKGRIAAGAFVEGQERIVCEAVLSLHTSPAQDSPLQSQALYGERVIVYEVAEGWAWVQLLRDGMVGYLAANALYEPEHEPTHRVSVPRTFAYPGPTIKMPPLMGLPLGARLVVTEHRDNFARAGHSFVFGEHLAPQDQAAHDPVAIAEMFLGVPYLWGGKTSLGLDCSGLVQISLDATGVKAPRDSDMQQAQLGHALKMDETALRRGDLIFWRGHVGMMQDRETVLHANGAHMMVVSEPLEVAKTRILASSGGPATAIKRL